MTRLNLTIRTMPAKDIYHDAVINALIKDGWRIVSDPYKIKYRDFEIALGQYILYRNLINFTETKYQIYLAIKDSIYENFFKRNSIQDITKINQLLLIVVDMEKEKILEWIN
jgi:hypothetical protein